MSVSTPRRSTSAWCTPGRSYNFAENCAISCGPGHGSAPTATPRWCSTHTCEWGESDRRAPQRHVRLRHLGPARSEKLVMIRDRMGIKPFYYYPTPDGVLFGSEPKAILANPLAGTAVDLDGLRELFAFVKTPGHAVWDGMREVEPGTVVTGRSARACTTALLAPGGPEHTDGHGRHRRACARTARGHRRAGSWSPTCLGARCSRVDWTPVPSPRSRRPAGERGEQVRSFAVDFVGQDRELRARRDARHPGHAVRA